jgi:hypothetical protein
LPAPELAAQVKLLEPGEQPRQALRYKFHLDHPETVAMDLRMAMGMEVGAAKQPETDTPGVRMTLQLTPKVVTPEGRLRYDFRLEAIEVIKDPVVRPDMVAAVEFQTRPLIGLAGSAEVDPRGMTRTVDFVQSPEASPAAVQGLLDNLRQSIRGIASPLPEEPVGKGATWEISIPVDTPAVKLTQISTHTLKEIRADKGKIDIGIRQEAAAQPIAFPGMSPGATASLESLVGVGSGAMEFDLNKLVPESTVSLTSTMTMKVLEQGTAQQVKVTMRVQVMATGKRPKP